MGLISSYRAFIAEFSTITSTDLLRKGSPEKVVWLQECDFSFQQIN